MSLDLTVLKRKSRKRKGPTEEVWSGNITHNLGRMAKEVKTGNKTLYDLLWYAPDVVTGEYVKDLVEAFIQLEQGKDWLEEYNAPNGWGTYYNLFQFLSDLITCGIKPGMLIRISK